VGAPLYQLVIDHVQAGIRSGMYPPGSRLPTIAQLAELTEVSQTSVKTALLLLNERGWIHGQQGKGSFVADNPPTD